MPWVSQFNSFKAVLSNSKNVLGPFDPTYSRSQSVDFSSMVSVGSYDIILPLRAENDVWSFIKPFSVELWIFSLGSIPIIMLAMALADYLRRVETEWATLVGFVLRNILSENMGKMPEKYNHQKFLTCIWMLTSFVLVMAYAGNLTAMIATPNLDMKFNKPEDLLYQQEITLVVEDGVGALEYMRRSPPGSTMSRLLEKTEVFEFDDDAPLEWMENCFTTTGRYIGNYDYGAVCDIDSIKIRMSNDFSETGQCNWYKTKKSLFEVPAVMVFQVCIVDDLI